MDFKLFTIGQNKSALQQALDRDSAGQETSTEVENAPVNLPEAKTSEGTRPLFKKPRQPNAVFEVDLMGGWLKS